MKDQITEQDIIELLKSLRGWEKKLQCILKEKQESSLKAEKKILSN